MKRNEILSSDFNRYKYYTDSSSINPVLYLEVRASSREVTIVNTYTRISLSDMIQSVRESRTSSAYRGRETYRHTPTYTKRVRERDKKGERGCIERERVVCGLPFWKMFGRSEKFKRFQDSQERMY